MAYLQTEDEQTVQAEDDQSLVTEDHVDADWAVSCSSVKRITVLS